MHSQNLFLSSITCLASLAAAGPLHHRNWSPEAMAYYQTNSEIRHERPREGATSPSCTLPAPSAMPSLSLPPVSEGLVTFHVALGRGTQNYSCPTGVDPSIAPVALGATANLYNVSCMASQCTSSQSYPLTSAVSVAVKDNLQSPQTEDPGPIHPLGSGSVLSGHHYFTNATTPTFNLVQGSTNYGIYFSKKAFNVSAPAGSTDGPDGSTAVPWLKLTVLKPEAPLSLSLADFNPNVQEIYRVNTAGGNAPATCAGQPSTFQKQYAAEYWFFG